MHLPEHGRMSGRNVYVAHAVYNIFSYTYVHLMVLISYLILQCRVMYNLKLKEAYHLFFSVFLMRKFEAECKNGP
jgi:hypothetical protein